MRFQTEMSRQAWIADLKYALRALRKNPGFAAVAVLTMALGIGAGTAVFSVVHAVLLRPLPFRQPERLMMIWETREKRGEDREVVSYANFREWKEQSRTFERMAAYVGDGVFMVTGGEMKLIPGSRVSHDFFPALGIQPVLGRTFLREEERERARSVILLSYGFWQRLGGDPKLVGKTVQFDRDVFTVVGIMPRGFSFPNDSELWLPFADDDSRNYPGAHYLRIVGQLRAGATVEQARSEMQTIAARLKLEHPKDNEGIGANVVPLREQTVGDARGALLILMGAVVCVLLIACANVANLVLVRVTGRRRELALRLALGASRWRIARYLLTESLLLAAVGGALGVAGAYFLVRVFVALDPIQLPRIHEVAVDGRVLLYAAAAVAATGILFGLAPALRASNPGLANWLKEGSGASGGGEFGRNQGRSILAVAQIALAVTLMIGAGLLMRSFVMRVTVPLGFRPEGVLGVELPWSTNRHIDELLERLRGLPGVVATGAATAFPHDPAGTSTDDRLEVEGRAKAQNGPRDTGIMVATAGYFCAAGMTLRAGRFFGEGDSPDGPKVAVINEALMRRNFDGRNPIGMRFRREGNPWATVVGVAGNVKGFGVANDPMPTVYYAYRQMSWNNGVHVLVRTATPPAGLAGAVRKEVLAWNKRLLISKLATEDELLSSAVAVPRFYMLLIAGFALLALTVSAIGVYGTVNYSVSRRTHEIGVRMALGAERGDVMAMVLGQGMGLTAIGVALGLAGAWLSTKLLESLLFGVKPTDARAFACGTGVLVAAVLVACYIPARRATRVDPLEALRHE